MSAFDFYNYNIKQYKEDVKNLGLKKVWDSLLDFCISNDGFPQLLDMNNWGELYEIGLAETNTISKKEMGKYFTPEDVASLLSDFFVDLSGDNVCDVACGTGNLILAYLKTMPVNNVRQLILSNRLYLYDIDMLALKICQYSIGIIYGKDLIPHIQCISGDFISQKIHLPDNCKVISNPPYSKISSTKKSWDITPVIADSRELYSAFMEKIIKESVSSVIITPFSFIGSDKFYTLRTLLNNHSGMIFSFDNVPANIFNGRKHGIFNTNTANSVRAAITVVDDRKKHKGFRISPLIRFSAEERTELLNKSTLMELLPEEYQTVDASEKKYHKCFIETLPVYTAWVTKADDVFSSLISDKPTSYSLDVPTTCRYYLSATDRELIRDGKIKLYFKDEFAKEYAYCLLNSSFAYWYWRIFDGGITYPRGLMESIPIRIHKLNSNDKNILHTLVSDIKTKEADCLVYKMNAGKMQENIKFTDEMRDACNRFILYSLGLKADVRALDCVHSNKIFGGKKMGFNVTKKEAINQLIAKVYSSRRRNVLTKSEIVAVETYYKNNYSGRNNITELVSNNEDIYNLIKKMKSGKAEIEHQLAAQKGLQRGIIAECVFAQSLANILGFNKFVDLESTPIANIPREIKKFFDQVQDKAQTGCAARYAYYKAGDFQNVLFQYGNPVAAGDATVFLGGNEIIIEIKDVPALLMDTDLLYDEDGKLIVTEAIRNSFPEYTIPIETFNNSTSIFEHFGHNYSIFEDASQNDIIGFLQRNIGSACRDVLMTSTNDELVVIKVEDLVKKMPDGTLLLSTQGSEIRTTGKNHKKVFTPEYSRRRLTEVGVLIDDNQRCKVSKHNTSIIGFTQGRGRSDRTRLKLTHCFFVKNNPSILTEDADYYYFDFDNVLQSKSGIAIHISLSKSKDQIRDELYSKIMKEYKDV